MINLIVGIFMIWCGSIEAVTSRSIFWMLFLFLIGALNILIGLKGLKLI